MAIEVQRIDDLRTLIQVAANQREARSLAVHFSGLYGFEVTPEDVKVASVIAGCSGKSLEEIVQLSRTEGPLLVETLRKCNELNGWESGGGPFGSAGGGTGSSAPR